MDKLIEKWKLNKGLLAKKMNMPTGTFCNKLSPKHSTEFSIDELIKLKLVLKELQYDILNVVHIDFNDALKAVVVKPIKSRGCCSKCGEWYDNEQEWLYNTKCEICGHPIPKDLIIKKPKNK